MTIDLGSIGIVAGVGFVAAVGVVLLYAFGLRLLGAGQPVDPDGDRTPAGRATVPGAAGASGASTVGASPVGASAGRASAGQRPPAAFAGAIICFGVCASAVLYGIWLTIPQFHQ